MAGCTVSSVVQGGQGACTMYTELVADGGGGRGGTHFAMKPPSGLNSCVYEELTKQPVSMCFYEVNLRVNEVQKWDRHDVFTQAEAEITCHLRCREYPRT